MKRVMMIVAAAVLTSTLLASAAEARGGTGGFGGRGHVGGFGADVYIGGGMGREGGEHAMHRLVPGDVPGCNYPDEAPKAPPWPPLCDQGVDRGSEE
jgi:hypothetical protein